MGIDWTKIELDSFYELYKITYFNIEWYYTSCDHEITYDGHTYTPATIKRGDITKESELNKVQIDLTFPITNFATRYISIAPVGTTYIYIYMYQDASNVLLAFVGEVTKISIKQNNTCAIALDEYTALGAKLPSKLIQPACNHILYDTGCGVNKATYTHSIFVDTVSDNLITSTDFAIYPDYYFNEGVCEFEGDMRWICFHAGTMVNIHFPFFDLEPGDTITCYAGCDKTPEVCDSRFSNIANYLGMPYVPRKNPVLYGI